MLQLISMETEYPISLKELDESSFYSGTRISMIAKKVVNRAKEVKAVVFRKKQKLFQNNDGYGM